jgi:hypothetical protein
MQNLVLQDKKKFPIGIVFDIETTGSRLTKNAMIELGSAIVNLETGTILDKLSLDIKMPSDREWEKRCLEGFWDNAEWKNLEDSPEKLKKKKTYEINQAKRERVAKGLGDDPGEAMHKLVAWIKDGVHEYAQGDSKRVFFLTDTVSFDACWINYYLDVYANHLPLHIFFSGEFNDVICTNSFAQGITKVSYTEIMECRINQGWFSREKHCRNTFSIPDTVQPETEHTHNAVDDATNIAQEHVIHLLYANKRDI